MTKTVTTGSASPATKTDGGDVTAAYLKVLDDAAERRGKGPAWLEDRRQAARELFAAHGVPHAKLEGFRTTDLRKLRSAAWPLAPERRAIDATILERYHLNGPIAVSVDGLPRPEESSLDLPKGLTLKPLSVALVEDEDLVRAHLGTVVTHDGPEETLRALNTAAFDDGWFLHVAKGAVIEAPVHLVHLTSDQPGPYAVFPRILIVAEEQAQVRVVSTFDGVQDGERFTSATTELVLGQGAVVDHVKVQNEPLQAYHSGAVGAAVARDAQVRDLSVAIGAAVSRNDVIARLHQGAEVRMDGMYLAKGTQLVDHHTWIDHMEPHGTSLERYKGVLDGKARGVFTGNVLVRQDAQKTNSEQENRNLLLSREALVDTTPQLEIHADDVKCAHGSTIGQLPKAQVFYLRSRGFTEEEAKRVLTEAFVAEVLEGLPQDAVRERLEGLVATWFEHRKEAL